MYNTAREKFDSVKNAAQEKFDATKRFIVDPIKDAVDKVKGLLKKSKDSFSDFKLKIPKPEMPKMPHFSLETSTKNVLGKDITYPIWYRYTMACKRRYFYSANYLWNEWSEGAGEAGRGCITVEQKDIG